MVPFYDDSEFEEIRRAFLQGTLDRTQSLEAEVLVLEKATQHDEILSSIRKLMSNVHSLKGSASAHQLPVMATIAHRLEDLLLLITTGEQKASPEIVSTLLKFVDLISKYAEEYLVNGPPQAEFFKSAVENLSQRHSRIEKKEINLNVLVVGASRTIARTITGILEEIGAQISYSSNGYEAVGRVLQEKFHLIITGVQMDPIDGLTLIGILKLLRARSAAKTILLTSDMPAVLPREFAPDYVVLKDQDMKKNITKVVNELLKVRLSPKKFSQLKSSGVRKIYFIDDDQDMIDLLKAAFAKSPEFELRTQNSSKLAVKEIKEWEPQLILCDLQMPDFDGRAIQRALKSEPKLLSIPIIFLTGDPESGQAKQALSEGALGVIDKSVVNVGFAHWLKELLSRAA